MLRAPDGVTFIRAINSGKYQQRTEDLIAIIEALNTTKAESIDSLMTLLKEYFVDIEDYARLPSIIQSKPITDESLTNRWLLSTALSTFKLMAQWFDSNWLNKHLDQTDRKESVEFFGESLEAFLQDVKRTLELC